MQIIVLPEISPERALFLLIILGLIAIIPMKVATAKGRDAFVWWIYGFFLFPFALMHALLMEPVVTPKSASDDSFPLRLCPSCVEPIQKRAIICKHCHQPVEPMIVAPPPEEPEPEKPVKTDMFDYVFVTEDGSFVATLPDGKAIAALDGRYHTFESISDVRTHRKDTSQVYRDATPEERLAFQAQMQTDFSQ